MWLASHSKTWCQRSRWCDHHRAQPAEGTIELAGGIGNTLAWRRPSQVYAMGWNRKESVTKATGCPWRMDMSDLDSNIVGKEVKWPGAFRSWPFNDWDDDRPWLEISCHVRGNHDLFQDWKYFGMQCSDYTLSIGYTAMGSLYFWDYIWSKSQPRSGTISSGSNKAPPSSLGWHCFSKDSSWACQTFLYMASRKSQ